MYKVWINTNENGVITGVYGGHEKYIVDPSDPYEYYFYVSGEVFKDIGAYTVQDGMLTPK